MLKSIKVAAKGDMRSLLFYVANFLFWAPLVLSTIYCYARLDYVRSYKNEAIKTIQSTSIESNVNNTGLSSTR